MISVIYRITVRPSWSCHDAKFVIMSGTEGCCYGNLICSQWWQIGHHDNSQFLVYVNDIYCDTDRLLFNIFQWDLRFSKMPDTWSYEVKHIFQELGDDAIFNAQQLCDLEESYDDMFILEQECWNCAQFGFDKMWHYNLYTGDYTIEDYVTANFSRQQRSIMAQFGAGILMLEIEVSRYRNVLLRERMFSFSVSVYIIIKKKVIYL